MSQHSSSKPSSSLTHLFILSVLILFLEMLLIRWIGTEIRIFAYVQNIILIVCFFGLGVGCLRSEQTLSSTRLFAPLLILFTIVVTPISRELLQQISGFLSVFEDTVIWYKGSTDSSVVKIICIFQGLLLAFGVLLLVFDVFESLGRLLGAAFSDSTQKVTRYSINIAGSLIGIWLFTLSGYLSFGPLLWAIILLGLFIPIFYAEMKESKALAILILLLPLPFVFSNYNEPSTIWSPYQKLSRVRHTESPGATLLQVNNVGYQILLDLSEKNVLAHPELFPVAERRLAHYDTPFQFSPNPRNVLILGAGSGNDAAGALRNGAEKVTVVEIDPVIIELGKDSHPEKPYESSRVTIINDDARAFLERTSEKFDVIIFGLLDAHTANALTNVRLDHFMYTKESLLQATSRLTEHGKLFLSFGMQVPFIVSRIESMLFEALNSKPLIFNSSAAPAYGWGGVMFVAGAQQDLSQSLSSNPTLAAWVEKRKIVASGDYKVPTDDWPYLYLPEAKIPFLYYLLGLVVIAIFLYRARDILSEVRTYRLKELHLFLLGAGFLLLETYNISRAALIFGNTWIVNAIVVSGIMIMTLFSNTTFTIFPKIQTKILALGLVFSLVILLWFSVPFFHSLPFISRAVLYGALISLPVFFSSMLFVRAFQDSDKPNQALAVNLSGALIGGLLQSLSFAIGMQGLLFIGISIYVLAIITTPKAIG